MADATIKNIPRNPALGVIADWLMSAKKTGGTIGDFFLGKSPEVLDSLSYGFKPTTGQGMTFGVKPEAVDLMNLTPLGSVAGMAGKPVAKMAGREIARQVETGTGILGRNVIDPRMNMIAYHGSPHSFDKFDMSKIGTGEGAQAYGHGLYFADNPNVAGGYVGGNKANTAFIDGKNASEVIKNPTALTWLEKSGGNPSLAIDFLKKELEYFTKESPSYSARRDINDAINEINSISNKNIVGAGNMYKVDIADEAIPNMLLWDKPLSEQPENVKQALEKLKIYNPKNEDKLKEISEKTLDLVNKGKGGTSEWSNLHAQRRKLQGNGLSFDATGQDAYKMLMEKYQGADNKASRNLLNQSVTGIRYLDSGSRGQGAGTMNTVVFDDKLVKILEKNGKPIK